jgi:hypothetical protein
VSLAAFRDPSYLCANIAFSVALATLVLAIINVLYGRGAGRACWAGFALCGWAYFSIFPIPGLRESLCLRLVPEVVLDLIYPHLTPPPPAPAPGISVNSHALYAFTIGAGLRAPPAPASRWSAWSQPDRTVGAGYPIGTVALVRSEAFRQICHSLAALLAEVLGGLYARGRYTLWAIAGDGPEPRRDVLA